MSAMGRSPISSTSTSSTRIPAPADPRRPAGKRLSHEDLSQLIIERELGDLIRALRRAPGASGAHAPLRAGRGDRPALGLVPRLEARARRIPRCPAGFAILQPLLSGVFTVDNLDYVRRDAYLTGVAIGPVDAERLRRYSFIGPRGLTLYEPGLGALEMFLTARLFMYQQVYFHRTVRAIDLDLAEVFEASIGAIFGTASPAIRWRATPTSTNTRCCTRRRCWSRGRRSRSDRVPGDGRVTPAVAEGWRAILLRRPRWRAEAEVRLEYEDLDAAPRAERRGLGEPDRRDRHRPGDCRRAPDRPDRSDRRPLPSSRETAGRRWSLDRALGRLPRYALIARRFRRTPSGL